ncbi:MAG: hypothetical protein AABX72_04775 [Nanoarchaeota archaeon]
MAATIEFVRRLFTKESGTRTEIPSPSVFRLTRKIDGVTDEKQLPCGYQTTILNSDSTLIEIAIIGPRKISVWKRDGFARSLVIHDWTIEGEKGVGHFTGKGFEPDGDGEEPERKLTDEVYFNDNLTELHFPDGLISFA